MLLIGVVLVAGCVLLSVTSGQKHETVVHLKSQPKLIPQPKLILMPEMLYGTAWKKEQTSTLVEQAITAGFTGIDTACQPRHYQEDLVGEGIQRALKSTQQGYKGPRYRGNLFIQTKFTPPSGQDEKTTPYDRNAPIATQVKQSLEQSLRNLRTTYLNSWLLHSPYQSVEDTLEAYHTMESLALLPPLREMSGVTTAMEVGDGLTLLPDRRVLQLGVSNVYDLDTFKRIYEGARSIKPSVLENRFTKAEHYSPELRAYCKEHGIRYQTFWTLTGNKEILATTEFREAYGSARRSDSLYKMSETQFWFGYLISIGLTPLAGPRSISHMEEDVEIMRNNFAARIQLALSQYKSDRLKSLLK